MKLAISDGREQKEAEVFEQNGHTVVMLNGQTFAFEFPAVDQDFVLLSDEELELINNHRSIQLVGNPNHDPKTGRFTSGHATAVAGAVTVAGLVAHTIAGVKIENKSTKIAQEKGISQAQARQRVLQQKAFSAKIGGKRVSVTYKQVEKGTATVATVGMVATMIASQMWINSEFDKFSKKDDDWYRRYNQQRENYQNRQQQHYERNRASWPKGATDDDFKNMYRKLAKKTHPDLGGKQEDFIAVDKFYKSKDWSGLKNLFDTAGLELELSNEEAEFFGLLVSILYEGLKDGSEYISFPVPDDVEELPPFVVGEDDDGKKVMVFDKWTAAWIVGSVMDNFEELDQYLGEKDERTD